MPRSRRNRQTAAQTDTASIIVLWTTFLPVISADTLPPGAADFLAQLLHLTEKVWDSDPCKRLQQFLAQHVDTNKHVLECANAAATATETNGQETEGTHTPKQVAEQPPQPIMLFFSLNWQNASY